MDSVTFKRVTPSESRIHDANGDHVGDVYRQNDILSPSRAFYVLHFHEDPRGPKRVHDRRRIRETARRLLASHPLF